MKKINPFHGLMMFSGLLLGISITAALIMESYSTSLDDQLGTTSWTLVTDYSDDDEDLWTFEQTATTAEEAFNMFRDYALEQSEETVALLKNKDNALPLDMDTESNITMMGLRSYACLYGNNFGSIPDRQTVMDNLIYDCFEAEGFTLNPEMFAVYENYTAGMTFYAARGAPEYAELYSSTPEIFELSLDEMAALNPSYNTAYSTYDTAVVVVGRPAGESNSYYIQDCTASTAADSGQVTTTGNIMGLSVEEKAIIEEAKSNCDKVIVIINATNTMEFQELVDDDGIDAIVWAGHPGAYGWYNVAKVLTGEVNPSAHLGDTYVVNNATNPALQSFGNIPWENADDFTADENVNSYLVEAEGIYAGYRYYETRYSDIVTGTGSNPSYASAGTYTTSDYQIGTVAGTWDYNNEIIYPFGYGLSYTTFEQTISVDTTALEASTLDKTEPFEVEVTVRNTGSVPGKSVIQLYGQAPYIEGGVEKSAIQLIDFEKTDLLDPNESQTITLYVDLANFASYDEYTEETYILDEGTYYFSIGDDAHDALNNILAAQGYSTSHGMDAAGDASKTASWTWSKDVETFSVSSTGYEVTNQLSNDDDYSMDLNTFSDDIGGTTVTYLTRSNWDGTFPESYAGLSASGRLATLLGNDFIDLATDDDTSEFEWGVDNGYTIYDFKFADWDDERWDDLIDQITIEEFLAFAQDAFHTIAPFESISYAGNNSDDGPNGSDSYYFESGTYQGVAFEDADEYEGYGTRVAPSCTNLAYSFNKELAYKHGEIALGETSLMFTLPIMIGPAANIHRHGYNGRGGEYYSEDPILSGYIGSNATQGAMSKGVLVNLKHTFFNDQEINRSGIAVFMNEQKARELELRNFQQAFEAKGKASSMVEDSAYDDTFVEGVNGVMSSYNRIGAVASSANYNCMVNIMRNEWGFNGYNVTDFTSVQLRAAPKESLLAGTSAFCGLTVDSSIEYWSNPDLLYQDKDMCEAIKLDIKYNVYSLANSNAMNGTNETTRRVNLMTWWRAMYISLITVFSVAVLATGGLYVWQVIVDRKKA